MCSSSVSRLAAHGLLTLALVNCCSVLNLSLMSSSTISTQICLVQEIHIEFLVAVVISDRVWPFATLYITQAGLQFTRVFLL